MYAGKIWDLNNQPVPGVLVTLLEPTADNTDITTVSGPDGSFVLPVDFDLTGFGLLMQKKNYWNQVKFALPEILAQPLYVEKIRFPWFIIAILAGFVLTNKKNLP